MDGCGAGAQGDDSVRFDDQAKSCGSVQPGVIVIREAETYVARIDSLEEITLWLGTFRERLRQARIGERDEIVHVVETLEDKYRLRRAELS